MLLVEFGELIEVIEICACSWLKLETGPKKNYTESQRWHTSFNRVEFLTASTEMESLDKKNSISNPTTHLFFEGQKKCESRRSGSLGPLGTDCARVGSED